MGVLSQLGLGRTGDSPVRLQLLSLSLTVRIIPHSETHEVTTLSNMHEIVTLQLGQRANYLATHFWNIQVFSVAICATSFSNV